MSNEIPNMKKVFQEWFDYVLLLIVCVPSLGYLLFSHDPMRIIADQPILSCVIAGIALLLITRTLFTDKSLKEKIERIERMSWTFHGPPVCAEFFILNALRESGFTPLLGREKIGIEGFRFVGTPWKQFSQSFASYLKHMRVTNDLFDSAEIDLVDGDSSLNFKIHLTSRQQIGEHNHTEQIFSQDSTKHLSLTTVTDGSKLNLSFELKFRPPPVALLSGIAVTDKSRIYLALRDAKLAENLGKLFSGAGIAAKRVHPILLIFKRFKCDDLVIANISDCLRLFRWRALSETKFLRHFVGVAMNDADCSRLSEERLRGVRYIRADYSDCLTIDRISLRREPDAILIDDDSGIHRNWIIGAEENKGEFSGFRTTAAFFSAIHLFDNTIPVYIDSLLGRAVKGEEVARIIRAYGFQTIYLETSHDPDDFQKMS